MKTVYEFIDFVEIPGTSKTRRFLCKDEQGTRLGMVRWYNAWRQYCYLTMPEVAIYHNDWLRDIAHFLDQLNDEHKEILKTRARERLQSQAEDKCEDSEGERMIQRNLDSY